MWHIVTQYHPKKAEQTKKIVNLKTNLVNKRVLVTGGALRIGAEIVKAFASEGAKVAFSYRKSSQSAKELLREIGGKRVGHTAFKLDLSEKIPKDIFTQIGGADILINSASVYHPEKLAFESEKSINEQITVNLLSPIILSKLFARQNIKSGCIINIVDCRISGLDRADGSYWLSKKSLESATKMLAVQLAPKIRVNAVAPGAILPPSDGKGFSARAAANATPLKRLPSVSDLLETILFVAQNNSITGQTVFVDCGRHLGAQRKI
ncbi:MAG TPA: SDR family oxidoreductase [Victivallales bacterium]|nr:SDR family oxidoreductase [Victivallales bacterium]